MTASRSNKRSAWMVPRTTVQRSNHPEQVVARELTTGQVLRQESTDDSLTKKAPSGIPFEEEVRSFKTDELDNVFIITPPLPPTLERGDGFYGGTDGNRLHFRYGDPFDSRPSNSDDEDLSDEEEIRDQEFARTCIKVVASCLSRRISRAMIDLIGIEPNPGPTAAHDKLMKQMMSQIQRLSVNQSGGKKKKGKINRSNRPKFQQLKEQVRSYSIPAAMGSVVPKSYFKTSPNVQTFAAQDARGAVRCYGLALYSAGITNYPSVSSGVNGGFASSDASDSGIGYLHPFSVDPRLAQYATTYQWYAFRKICVKYVPFVGTTTDGGLYLGVYRDTAAAVNEFTQPNPSGSGFGGGTRQDISDVDPNFSTSVWLPGECTFTHGGTQLWECFPSGEEPADERIQAALVCITETDTVTASTAKTYGHIYFEYEIDFYVPGPPSSTESDTGPPPVRTLVASANNVSAVASGLTVFGGTPPALVLDPGIIPALDTLIDINLVNNYTASAVALIAAYGSGGTISQLGSVVSASSPGTLSGLLTPSFIQGAISAGQLIYVGYQLLASSSGSVNTVIGKAYTFGY